jgi:hypothetical protein
MSDKLPAVMALKAGAHPVGIVPTTFEECYRMAKLLSSTAMVPEAFRDKPDDCCVAIMQGLEVGLSPIAALNSIAVINGRPSLWGDGAMAVVRASGLAEHITETDDGETATCMIRRKGEDEPIVRKFSMADAKKAGLATKKGPWTDYPQRMRQMRARSWALRDGFADVLKGLHIAEEAQDIPMRDITPNKPAVLDVPEDIAPQASEAEAPQAEHEPLADAKSYLAKLKEDLEAAGSVELINEVWNANADLVEARLSRSDRATAESHLEKALSRADAR